jgi:hypothetical protein
MQGGETGTEAEPMSATVKPSSDPKPTWWCNFCNYKTKDQAAYLKHSCVDELKKQGKSPAAGDKKHCD